MAHDNDIVRIAGAVNDSIVDGPGLRFALFVQGCEHGCPGCHNPETHPVGEGGSLYTVDEIWAKIEANPLLDGVTFSGGEPMLQPVPLCELAQRCRARGLNVWCYSGYTYEELVAGAAGKHAIELLNACDVLVDGRFEQDRRSLDLRFRGSSNQRLVDLPSSRAAGEAVLWEL